MGFFRHDKNFSRDIKAVNDKADRTAEELERVKRRQEEIARRVNYLNQELEVQQRKRPS